MNRKYFIIKNNIKSNLDFILPQVDSLRSSAENLAYYYSEGFKQRKTFACEVCPFSTNIRTNYLNHIRYHTGEKPYACPFCDHKATQRSNLKSHMIRMHNKIL